MILRGRRSAAPWLAACLLLVACAGGSSQPGAGSTSAAGSPPARGLKRIVGAMQGHPLSGHQQIDATNSQRGNQEFGVMLHAGLTVTDTAGQVQARLAESVPNSENGEWRVLPDGTMETQWTIRPNVQWHDGTAFTTDDLIFTLQVARDRDLPLFRDPAFVQLSAVEALDSRTIVARWARPYIRADRLFGDRVATPLPRHLLKTTYDEDKANFTLLPYWNTEFVGLGPYRVKEWERGSYIVLQANPAYVLGRPRIDEIELRTIPDTNAIVASYLAGSVDLTVGRSISLDHVVQLRDRVPDALLQTPLTSLLMLNPQLLNPDPAVILDLSFRRALLHAIDRQEMADTINYGLVPIAETFIYPSMAEARAIDSAIVRYDYDPRKSAQMIEALGYRKGSDGIYQEGGRPLRIEIRATSGEANPRTMLAASDALQRLGVAIDPVVIPLQLLDDQRYRSTFPGLIVNGGPAENGLDDFHSRNARLPETNFSGRNRSRYMNPEADALIDRYLTTIAFEPRMEIARQITRHLTENLPALPLYYDSWPSVTSPHLVNVGASANGGQAPWNVHEWDLK